MNKIRNRKRLRRQYLRRKVTAIAGMGILGYIWIGCALTAAIVGVFSFIAFFVFIRDFQRAFIILVGGGLLACVYGGFAWLCWRGVKKIKAEMQVLPYHPPVTPDTLPAEEVLVRGATEPAVQSDMLLRAAVEQETPKEELLRVTSSE